MALPPFDEMTVCPKCLCPHVGTQYRENTSHYDCPLGKELRTGYGPEHFSRWCKRCHFQWEEAVLAAGQTSTDET